MALDAEDQARLRRIESDLASGDPAFASRLRSWRPSSRRWALPSGWSEVPGWALAVFLVAFAGWVLSPGVGALIVMAVAGARLWTQAVARVRPPRRGVPRRGR